MSHNVAVKILRSMREESDWVNMWRLADQLRVIFHDSIEILDEAEIAAFHNQEFQEMNHIINTMLDLHPPKETVDRLMHNKLFCTKIKPEQSITQSITRPSIGPSPFTIIFQGSSLKTIRSFFRACTDIVLASTIYYVYDTSSIEETETMLHLPTTTPHDEVKRETNHEIGFVMPRTLCVPWPGQSFALSGIQPLKEQLFETLVLTPYVLIIKNDWTFIDEIDYLTILRTILDGDESTGQVILGTDNQNEPQSDEDVRYERRKCFVSHGRQLNLETPSMIAHHVLRERPGRLSKSVRLAGTQCHR